MDEWITDFDTQLSKLENRLDRIVYECNSPACYRRTLKMLEDIDVLQRCSDFRERIHTLLFACEEKLTMRQDYQRDGGKGGRVFK